MSMISIQGVTKRYANHTAIDGINIEIPEQCIYGLLGPNGAGKTSLIRILTQITAADEGKIMFNGEPLSPEHISVMGYLPEERGLYKKMKIGDQALYFARLKGLTKMEAKKRIRYWFDKFDINSWRGKKVEELSKGMAQKVQFINTVLHEPKLIILDEPFSGFDPVNAELIKNEILELRDKGATVILSTHRMESVEQMCDHVALIHKSKIVLDGDLVSIKEEYKTGEYTAEFKGELNGTITAADIISTEKTKRGDTLVRMKLKEGEQPNSLISQLMSSVQIHSFTEVLPSINDIFISIVKEDPSHE